MIYSSSIIVCLLKLTCQYPTGQEIADELKEIDRHQAA